MGLAAAIGHDVRGDQLQGQGDAQRDDDQVVQIADDRDEVGDQVNRTEGVGDDGSGEGTRIPGGARVTDCQVQNVGLAL